MDSELAKSFVTISARTGGFDTAIGRLQGSLNLFANGSALAFAGILGGAALAVGAIARAAKAASDLKEVNSKIGVIFGGQAKIISAAADEMARKFGVPKREFLDGAAGLGRLGKTAGLSAKAAAEFGVKYAKLAVDLSSMDNIPFADAVEKITSGLSGMAIPLRKNGAFLSKAAVQQEAYRMGLAKVGGALTEQQKIMARASLISKGLADDVGDLERTQDSFANRMREASGRAENAWATLGEALAPLTDAFASAFVGVMKTVSTFLDENKAAINAWATEAAGWFSFLADGAGKSFGSIVAFIGDAWRTLQMLGRNWPDLMELIEVNLRQSVLDMESVLLKFGQWLGDNWLNLIRDAFVGVATIATNVCRRIYDAWAEVIRFLKDPVHVNVDWSKFNMLDARNDLLEGFKAKTGKLPDFANKSDPELDARRKAVTDRIAQREADFADAKDKAAKELEAKAAKAAAGPDDPKELVGTAPDKVLGKKDKEKSETVGALEFYRKVQSSIGKTADPIPSRQLDAANKTNDLLGKIATAVTSSGTVGLVPAVLGA